MTHHTPKPWKVCNPKDKLWYVETDNQRVCDLFRETTHPIKFRCNSQFDKANAYLIAAAPDLLEALKGMMEMHAPRNPLTVWSGPYAAAREAIIKAEPIVAKLSNKCNDCEYLASDKTSCSHPDFDHSDKDAGATPMPMARIMSKCNGGARWKLRVVV